MHHESVNEQFDWSRGVALARLKQTLTVRELSSICDSVKQALVVWGHTYPFH